MCWGYLDSKSVDIKNKCLKIIFIFIYLQLFWMVEFFMLTISELLERWDIFKAYRNTFSIVELMLFFSHKDLSPEWSELDKEKQLKNMDQWPLPDPKNNVKHRQVLSQIIECLILSSSRSQFVDQLSLKYAWVEQWCSQALKYEVLKISQYESIASTFQRRGFLVGSEQALIEMLKQNPTTPLMSIVTSYFFDKKNYSKAIYFQKKIIDRSRRLSVHQHQQAQLYFIELLLLRSGQYTHNIMDLELAYSLLCHFEGEKDARYEACDQKIRNRLVASNLFKNTGISTTDKLFLKISRFNFNTAHKFFGGNSELPYYRDLVISAPLAVNQEDIQRYFRKHVHLSQIFNQILTNKNLVDEHIFQASTLSAFMLWSYSQVDTQVLDAIRFSSADKPSDFFDLKDRISDLSQGAITRLSGYVAEQQVALNLQQQGHHVQFPEKSNQEGFDLLVDGHPIQVKCTLSVSYVQGHLNQYPDIPVIVNKELAEAFLDHPQVIIDEQLSHTMIQNITVDSVHHLEKFGHSSELLLAPLITFIFSSKRHYDLVKCGEYELKDAVTHTTIDSGARLAGILSGKTLGFALGSLGGPIGAIVGATAGAYLGNIFASAHSDQFLKKHVTLQGKKVAEMLKSYAIWFAEQVICTRITLFEQDLKQNPLPVFYDQLDIDDAEILLLHFRFLHEKKLQRIQEFQKYLNFLLGSSFAHAVQAGWVCLENSDQFYHPQLKERLQRLNHELQLYQKYALQPSNYHHLSNECIKH